ncbi:MAG: gfo/Idh/MocA family oxidoreductase [Candidatus Parabeggiatoa sp. nov. 1]|nr:MAG: gfo/Idh/MocA family oxidoreductase [Gammaproteobacteria bacterium]
MSELKKNPLSLEKQVEPVRIGIVGAGFFGQVAHIANYAEIKDCRIVALSVRRPELRRKVAQRYDIPRTYPNHYELLEDSEVEAVVIVTPRHVTARIAQDCLNADKAVLTEKPMATTLEPAEKLVEVACSKQVTYAVGYMKRYDEGVQRAKQILDELTNSGELGSIVFTRVHCFGENAYCNCDGHIVTDEKKIEDTVKGPMAPDWVPKHQQQTYHQYLNKYCHNINLIRYLLGRTPSVRHVQFNSQGGQVAILDFEDHTAVLETGDYSYHGWDEVIEIYFAQGRLRIETPPPLLRNVPAKVELYKGGEKPEIYSPLCGWTWAFRRQAEAFIEDVRHKQSSLTSGEDALEDIRLIEKMWKMEFGINKGVVKR